MINIKTLIDKPLRSLAVAALTLCVTGAPLAAQAPNSQLDQAVAALRGISTMTADFTQTEKLNFRKYDPVARKHVEFKEAKIK